MEIRIDKNIVEFTPDSDKETKELEALWRLIIDCARFSRKMVPIGEYIPSQKNMARFVIEGEMLLTIGDETKLYKRGDSYYIPEGVVHSAEFKTFFRAMDFFAEPTRYETE